MSVGQQVLVGKHKTAAGQRDRLVTIQQVTESVGSSGFPVETWSTLGTEYMGRLDVRADERFSANQLSAAAETQWYLNYRADMDPEIVNVVKTRRLSYKGRIYDILAATLIDRRAIELVTLAKVDG